MHRGICRIFHSEIAVIVYGERQIDGLGIISRFDYIITVFIHRQGQLVFIGFHDDERTVADDIALLVGNDDLMRT